ncbi:MAG: ATP-binding protein [Synergistaceae bacterium]|nr:ATP-binding protein [Synergistaceae bacterium]
MDDTSILFCDEAVYPRTLESIELTSLRLDEWFENGSVPLETRNDIHICVDELMSNFFYYSEASEIRVKYILYNDDICITLSDDGVPFDPMARESRVEKPEKGKRVQIGGLGITMVRQMTKKMTYQYEEGRNTLELYFAIA